MRKLTVLSFLMATSFSLLGSIGFAAESADVRKVDILFVIDNSGSMTISQSDLKQNLSNFINTLDKNVVKMAITTTDAFYGQQFLDVGCSLCNVNQTKFRNSIEVGVNGSGDERAFSSFKAALESPLNTDFHRPNAYLSVIIVSDADDFSHDTMSLDESYTQPTLHPVEKYASFLANFTSGKPKKDFSVSTIGVLDSECRDQLAGSGENKIGLRYMKLSKLTGGVQGSICSPISTNLEKISQAIRTESALR